MDPAVRPFQPDAHSRLIPVWEAPAPDEARLGGAALWALWGHPGGVAKVAAGGTVNSRNYLVGPGPRRTLVLKRLPDGTRYRQALSVVQAVAPELFPLHYAAAGAEGKRYVPEHGGFAWILMERVPGHSFQGDRLGELGHAVRLVLEALAKADGAGLEVREPMTDEEVRLLVAMNDPAIQEHLEEVLAERGRLRAVPRRPTHIDLHAHNVLVDSRGRVTFMDVDSVRLAPIPVALGYAAFKLCRQAAVARGNPAQAARRFLRRALGSAIEGADDLIWLGAKAELLKRIAFIEAEQRRGRTEWLLDGARHRLGLEEIDRMRTDRATRRTA